MLYTVPIKIKRKMEERERETDIQTDRQKKRRNKRLIFKATHLQQSKTSKLNHIYIRL